MHFAKVPPDYEAAGVRGALQMNREKARKTRSSKSCLRGMEVAEYTALACEFLMFLFCRVHVHVR